MTEPLKSIDQGPGPEDLAYASIEGSSLFGLTNLSGKLLTIASTAGLGTALVGVAQAFGYLGAVAGAFVTFPIGATALGISAATGLLGYYLGNFDDKRITQYNDRIRDSWATGKENVYGDAEDQFLTALSKAEYDPGKNTLPYADLGRAVLLPDTKLRNLPAHVRLDVYRTQAELELYRIGMLGDPSVAAAREYDKGIVSGDKTPDQKADYFRQRRDQARAWIAKRGATPAPAKRGTAATSRWTIDDDDAQQAWNNVKDDLSDAIARALRNRRNQAGGAAIAMPWGNASASAAEALPDLSGSDLARAAGIDSIGSSTSSSSDWGKDIGDGIGGLFKGSSSDNNKDAAGALLLVVAAAAIAATFAITGSAIYRNFLTAADKPLVKSPLKAKGLRTAEPEVRAMYGQMTPA